MRLGRAGSTWSLTGVAVFVASLFTLAVAVLPFVRYAYRSPALHIAIDAADAVIALVVAYLVYGRYRLGSRRRDLLLTSSLLALALANLPLTVIPAALAQDGGSRFDAWAPLLVRTFAAVLLVFAAFTPRNRVVDRAGARRWAVGFLVVAGWLITAGALAAERLPPAVPVDMATDATGPLVTGHPLVLAAQALGFVLYAGAAYAFTRTAARENDEFLSWMGAAAVLGAGARLNYLLFPSLYSDYLYTGDALRLGFYMLMLVGAAREVSSYWSARVEAALERGRRDATREVRDVVVPRLRDLVDEVTAVADAAPEQTERALRAARLVLAEAEVLAALSSGPPALEDEPLERTLRDALAPIADRYSMRLLVRVDPGLDVADSTELLVSLACEAVRAAGAASASEVRVRLRSDPLAVIVSDDAPEPADPECRAAAESRMRVQAEQSGGVVLLGAAPGHTVVRVDWL